MRAGGVLALRRSHKDLLRLSSALLRLPNTRVKLDAQQRCSKKVKREGKGQLTQLPKPTQSQRFEVLIQIEVFPLRDLSSKATTKRHRRRMQMELQTLPEQRGSPLPSSVGQVCARTRQHRQQRLVWQLLPAIVGCGESPYSVSPEGTTVRRQARRARARP